MGLGRFFGGGGKTIHEVEIRGDSSGVEQASERTEKSLTGAMVKSQLAVQALNKAFELTKKVVSDVAQNALQYERTMNRQAAATAKFGRAADDVRLILNQQASELQALTAISDETIRDLQSMALSFGVAFDEVDDFVTASIRLSNAFDMDLVSAMRNLAKTTSGLTGELGEAIPQIRTLTKEQLQAGEAVRLINDEWADFIDVKARGAVGGLEQLQRAYEDLTEAIGLAAKVQGTFFADLTQGFTGFMEDVATITSAQGLGAGAASLLSAMFGDPTEVMELADALRSVNENAAVLAERRLELTGGAKPTKGGAKPAGKVGKKKGGIEFDFSAAYEADLIITPDGTMMPRADWEQLLSEQQAHADNLLDMTLRVQRLKEEMKRRHLEYLIDLDRKAAKEEVATVIDLGKNVTVVYQGMANAALQTIDAWATGQEVALGKIVGDAMRMIGRRLYVQGTADLLEGGARVIRSYGSDATGWKLAGIGAAEIAAGTGFMAGGGALGQAAAPASVAGGTGGSPAAGGQFAGGAFGGGEKKDGGGPTQLTINVNGALMSKAEVGVAISEALREARQQGYQV